MLFTFVLFDVNTLFLLSTRKKRRYFEEHWGPNDIFADCSGYFTENISQSFNCHFEAKQSYSNSVRNKQSYRHHLSLFWLKALFKP